MINYNSALKVVNLGEPEASLILRKPRSPQGQGGADAASPTGLTHVGGPRWETTEHPAYRAILDWIREASASAVGAGRNREALGRQLRPELRAGQGRRRRPRHDLAHRVCRRDARLSARAGRRPGCLRQRRGTALRPPPGQPQRPRQGLRDPGLRRRQDLEQARRRRVDGPTTRHSSTSRCRVAPHAMSSFAA